MRVDGELKTVGGVEHVKEHSGSGGFEHPMKVRFIGYQADKISERYKNVR
jgi:hypothetical protein